MGKQVTTNKKDLYETIYKVDFIDTTDLSGVIHVFDKFSIDKVILNKSFEDNIWLLNDEYNHVSIDFIIDELALKRSCIFKEIEYHNFIIYLKIYVLRLLGSYVTLTIQSFVREIKEVIRVFDGETLNTKIKLQAGNLLLDFVELIDFDDSREYEQLLALLEVVSEENIYKGIRNRRQLSSFQSYFKFNDLINDFWEQNISIEQRIFYFPLYIWWHLTTILPLRPREFLLIPRDCFQDKKSTNTLTFRRTKLKGSKKNVSYSIDNDYELCHYNIGEKLANHIKHYIVLTEKLEENELNTLFRADIHYDYFGKKKRYDSRLFTYANMRYCLRKFYMEIICDMYSYDVVNIKQAIDDDMKSKSVYSLKNNEIEFINLGDTRHIAMINIVASGGTPSTAMMLAGHTSIEMSSHYFANISTLIECKTYQNYLNTVNESDRNYVLDINHQYSLMSSDRYIDLGDGKKCYSVAFSKEDYQDCMKSIGEKGEIGDCNNCTYYRSGNYRIFFDDRDIYLQRINDDCDFLAEQINLYRQGKGYEEDVKKAILRLQSSSKSYEKYFHSSLVNGGK